MELRVLQYFLMVAREENITRAAEILHITQPTLSRQLMQLETELGVKLFVRGQHSISLTNDGQLLRRRAQEILSLTDKARQELSHEEEDLSGTIAIGCGETTSVNELSRIIAGFRRLHPEVQFEINTAIADDIKVLLDRGLLDFGLLAEPVEISRYHFIRMPRRDVWAALIDEHSPLARKPSLTPEDLSGIPLIMVKRESVRNELASWFGDLFDKLDIAASYTLIYNAAIMIKNQIGTAALGYYFESSFEGICYRPLSPELSTGSVFVWKNQTVSAAASAFLAYFRDSL